MRLEIKINSFNYYYHLCLSLSMSISGLIYYHFVNRKIRRFVREGRRGTRSIATVVP